MKNGKYSANNKRRRSWRMKPVTFMVAVLLLVLVAFGVTLAYLMDSSDSVKNTFVPGRVEISVNEPGWEEGPKDVKENVTIKNEGTVSAEVRAKIIVTWQKLGEDGKYVIYPKTPVARDDYSIVIPDNTGWSAPDANGWYTHGAVPAGGQTDVLIERCSPVDDNTPEGYHLVVDIIAEAIQAEGITGTRPWGE